MVNQTIVQNSVKVEQLSACERIEPCCANMECMTVSEDLTDEDFASLAAAMFRTLDEEEAQRA